MLGIKVVNIHTNKVVRLVGKTETHRFLNVDLYQGKPRRKALITLVCCVYKTFVLDYRNTSCILVFINMYRQAMAASDNPLMKESEIADPTLFCTAYKRNRFFMFTRREHDA
jgi:peptidylprolyl isomerase domain and WD repeat-containing protein 1